MSSKRGMRRAACTGKIRFATQAEAAAAGASLWRAQGEHCHAYRCAFCRAWHIGHAPGRRQHRRT